MSQVTETVVPIDLLEAAFTSVHYPELFKGEATHEPGLRFVAQLLPFIQDPDRILAIVASGLPPGYRGNLLDEIPKMARSGVAKGYADRPKRERPQKPSATDQLLKLFEGSGAELFHDASDRAFISVALSSGGAQTFPVRSSEADRWLRRLYTRETRKGASAQQIGDALSTIEAQAWDAPEFDVHLRYARRGDSVFIDLGRDDRKVVRISSEGWSTTHSCPVKFIRSRSFGELPEPSPCGSWDAFRDLIGIDENGFHLLLAFLLNAMRPGSEYMCLLVEGEQGSGKSQLCELIKRIVDPNAVPKFRLPDSEHDLMIQAKEQHLLIYDNASGLKGEISDCLCSLATGGGFGVRKLYTDDELHVFAASRPFVINGISDVATRPDLLERSIAINLPPMSQENRKRKSEIDARFEAILPGLLGNACDAIVCALQRQNTIACPTEIRMADSAHWIAAAEHATGLPEGTLIAAMTQGQTDQVIEKTANDPVVFALRKVLERAPFENTTGHLFDRLKTFVEPRERYFPATAQHLSRRIARMRPALKKLGIHVEPGPKTREGRIIRAWLEAEVEKKDDHPQF